MPKERRENGNPLQYSCLENPMDREAWWATVHGVTRSQTRLSTKRASDLVVIVLVGKIGSNRCLLQGTDFTSINTKTILLIPQTGQ